MPPVAPLRLQRAVLLGPAAVARAAAGRARLAEERWLLRQPRPVRASYVREVLDRPGRPRAQEAWMLRQPDPVRESYLAEVVEAEPA
jgi:hypothetical protein